MKQAAVPKILAPYGVPAPPELCALIRSYMDMLLKWNQKVSLTSITDPAEIVARHFGESLFAAQAVPIRARRLVDVGSGAGFPGLALKLVLPETHVTLVEANAKKAAFLNEVVRTLCLERVSVVRGRTEEIDISQPIADYVTARATGHYEDLLDWSLSALGPGGKLVLWIGADEAEHVTTQHTWSWSKPILMPNSARRMLLVGLRP
jgi:16S rRNA (guanine527-N7)-methyltransferase